MVSLLCLWIFLVELQNDPFLYCSAERWESEAVHRRCKVVLYLAGEMSPFATICWIHVNVHLKTFQFVGEKKFDFFFKKYKKWSNQPKILRPPCSTSADPLLKTSALGPNIHTPLAIGSNSGFSILPKDTSTCWLHGLGSNQQPSGWKTTALPHSHSRMSNSLVCKWFTTSRTLKKCKETNTNITISYN